MTDGKYIIAAHHERTEVIMWILDSIRAKIEAEAKLTNLSWSNVQYLSDVEEQLRELNEYLD